jgi:hypothetical protein
MSMSHMQEEDRLEGARNSSPCKTMITFSLEGLELWYIVHAPVVIPHATAPVLVADFKKRNKKAKRTICDGVRDHVIPHLTGKGYAFEIWESFCKLYQSPNRTERWFCKTSSGAFRCSIPSRLHHSLVDSLRSEMSLQPSET